jgi:hypothetical protein
MPALRAPSWLGAGLALLAWAVDFAIMYALVTFACARPGLGWIATTGCAAVALAVLVRALRTAPPPSGDLGVLETSRLERDIAALTALLSLIAILWLGVAVLSPPACWPPA